MHSPMRKGGEEEEWKGKRRKRRRKQEEEEGGREYIITIIIKAAVQAIGTNGRTYNARRRQRHQTKKYMDYMQCTT